MEAKSRFKVKLSNEAQEFLDGLPNKVREKIISNIRKSTFVLDPDLFKKLDDTDIWEFPYSTILSVFGMTASLKTSQSSLVCVIGCAKLTEGVVLSGSTVCSPYIMRVVCSDIATVTKAQLSAAGFLRGWCAPFRVAGIWSSNWVSVLSGPTGNVTVA